MTTSFDTDPNTQTVAAAWASSPLGQPEHEVRFGFAEPAEAFDETDDTVAAPTEDRRSVAKHALIALVLAGGMGAGAALGLMFLDVTPDGPIVVVPGSSSPEPAVVVTPDTPSPTESVQDAAPSVVAPAPRATGVGTPPAPAAETVVVEVPSDPPAPAQPAAEEPQAPQPENQEPELPPVPPDPPVPPQPPLPDDLDLKLPEPPKPKPPVFVPDLPLAPAPQPKPDPKPIPPEMPDFEISAGPGS